MTNKNNKWDYNPSGNLMDQTTRRLMCSALLSDSIIKCYDVGDDETFWSGDIDMLLVNKDFKIDTLEVKAVGFGNARNSLDELSVFLEYISNDKKYLLSGGKQGIGCTRICKATYYLFYFTKIDYYLLFETKQLQDFLERNLEKFPSKASVTYGKNGEELYKTYGIIVPVNVLRQEAGGRFIKSPLCYKKFEQEILKERNKKAS